MRFTLRVEVGARVSWFVKMFVSAGELFAGGWVALSSCYGVASTMLPKSAWCIREWYCAGDWSGNFFFFFLHLKFRIFLGLVIISGFFLFEESAFN